MPPSKKAMVAARKKKAYTAPKKNVRAYTVTSSGQKRKNGAKTKKEKVNPLSNPKIIISLLLVAVVVGIFVIYSLVHTDSTKRIFVVKDDDSFHDAVYATDAICNRQQWIELNVNGAYERMYKVTVSESETAEYFHVSTLYTDGEPRILLGEKTDGTYYLIKYKGTWYVRGDPSTSTIAELTIELPKISDTT